MIVNVGGGEEGDMFAEVTKAPPGKAKSTQANQFWVKTSKKTFKVNLYSDWEEVVEEEISGVESDSEEFYSEDEGEK